MEEIKPKAPIRRFDVFAEYTRLQALKDGMSPEEAKGYALWLAKVVAARKYGLLSPRPPSEVRKKLGERIPEIAREERGPRFYSIGGIKQTDELFDKEIIRRMGEEFYYKVFSPAIEEAFRSGKKYEEIRDSIRKDWKP